MKKFLPLILVCMGFFPLLGQISINNSTFPNEGTVLKYFNLSNLTNVTQGQSGANITWNFNNFSGGQAEVEKYVNVSQGRFASSFPDANILILNSLQEDGEQYGKILNSRVEIVGFAGPNPFFGGEIAVPYSKRLQVRRSPMYYETTAYSEGTFNLGFPASVLPDTLLNSLPVKPDSIRVSITSIKNDTVDAWGKVMLKNKTYDVLREKSVIISSNKIEIKIPFIGWFDVSAIFGGGGGEPGGGPAFGNDTTTVYNFYTNTRKDVLVTIRVDSENNVFQAGYADVDNTISTYDYSLNDYNHIYPNPVQQKLVLENREMASGNYTARIVRMDGSLVSETTLVHEKDYPLTLEVSHLNNGAYALVLYPEKGFQIIRASFIVNH